MHEVGLLIVLVVVFALAFDYINGFHDTANAIATVVSTRVLTPLQAILMATVLNFAGALIANSVAKTIAGDIVAQSFATEQVVLAAVIGGIVWNLVTWKYGVPSSSSHALIGGLCGAALAHGGFQVIQWKGLIFKVLIPLVTSPIVGFIIGFVIMALIAKFFSNAHPVRAGTVFRRLQILSSAAMAFAHGQNDAQKSMGIITLALIGGHFLPVKADVPLWVKIACAIAMALGTSAGGWRIIRTMGHKIIRLEPVNGFAAETSGAAVILTASHFGMPLSTTHVIAGSIFGVGASKRISAVRWQVAHTMVAAWIITIPAAATVGALAYGLVRLMFR
ncbi:inorganic phosphate transporter [Fimbriimonas ginsengisoli]|uniref:Putative low-affinity inorganic phosphate transporter n=1 Tax=Fimbriimonas ginsengisoli Gsoil 348 TaxID=661478 RepID=A0A068NMM2_FIMGI|nr:inorganic phosphate transporter [Fimbriimonas ginsengisoli]AIE84706.1 putative low-affinity inorganic phosphate transporter [Fimbriimonas ginsengisoli Gsoil 348]